MSGSSTVVPRTICPCCGPIFLATVFRLLPQFICVHGQRRPWASFSEVSGDEDYTFCGACVPRLVACPTCAGLGVIDNALVASPTASFGPSSADVPP